MKDLKKTYAWQQTRAQFLGEHPLCVMCLTDGRTEAATVVDHVVPHRDDPALFWDEDNLQSLCKRHHDSRKQAQEKSGKGYHNEIGLDGKPLDPKHPFYARKK